MSDSKLSRELRIQKAQAELIARNSFWPWFWSSGARTFRDRWLVVHGAIGVLLALAIPGRLSDAAVPSSVPFVAILVGLAVAWSGNAGALLQTAELQKAGAGEDGSYESFRMWALQYQAAVLVILACTTAWALAAAGLFNNALVAWAPAWARVVGRALLFGFSCLTVRECWQVVGAVQMKLLGQLEIRQAQERARRARQVDDAKRLPEKTQ
ncbi:hypothetical protein WME89_16275 [Sorangium sp. So ce321]|uniref:hypothetical protein n=1 Tax=Sorangium sp. So ce321 TaxID=3133300 RepID=UPI003F5DCCAE